MNKFKKGDQVIIIAGSHKKKIGNIKSINGDRVVVDGVNIVSIHKKPTSQEPGKIEKIERAIHISNISHIENDKPVKIKFLVEKGDKKPFMTKKRISRKTEKNLF